MVMVFVRSLLLCVSVLSSYVDSTREILYVYTFCVYMYTYRSGNLSVYMHTHRVISLSIEVKNV
jgi:hypothetical protein